MSTTVLSGPADPTGGSSIRLAAVLALAVWLVLVLSLGALGAFVGLPGTPPVAIALGAGAPLLLFFACLRLSNAFRDFVLSLDLRLVAGMQAWRWHEALETVPQVDRFPT